MLHKRAMCICRFFCRVVVILAVLLIITFVAYSWVARISRNIDKVEIRLRTAVIKNLETKNKSIRKRKMKFHAPAVLAVFAAPILAQSTTPAPTPTTNEWWGAGPPWATTDPAKWSSIYNSLVSEGRIPSTLTAAPWPTGGWGPGGGPGGGPWGPGGGRGGPPGGGHWGGTYMIQDPYIPLQHPISLPSTTHHITSHLIHSYTDLQQQAPMAPPPSALPTTALGPTGPRAATGAPSHGPHGGEQAHVHRPTGPAGRLGPGAPRRRGRHGRAVRPRQRLRAWLLRQ
jgi:type II secretory pathway pseudopilin PulG